MKHEMLFQKYNFFRVPGWRFERVLKLVDKFPKPSRSNKRDDKWVKGAREFILRWRNKELEDDREDLWVKNPGLYYAYDLYLRKEDQPEGAAFIEARLLARQSYDEIADCLGTIPDTIEWYEALFFNVADKLQHRDWITAQVLLPSVMKYHGVWKEAAKDLDVALPFKDSSVARPFLDATLKLFAYFGGRYLVDIMISGFQSGKPLTSPDGMAEWFDEHMAMTVRRRSSQAAMQFEINKYNITELLTVHTRIMEIERSEENRDKQKTATERHIQAMMDGIPWVFNNQKQSKRTLLNHLDDMSSELRDDEILQLASGEVLIHLKDNFPKELPPPKKKISKLLGHKDLDL